MTYHSVGTSPLSHSQKLKLIKGLPVRIKLGNHHNIEVSAIQHKKIHSAHKKGKAHTLSMDPHQAQMHGEGLMGDLFKSLKNALHSGVSFVKKHKLQKVANPLIDLGKKGLHTGLNLAHAETGLASPFWNPLARYGHRQIDNIPQIGEGFGMDLAKALGPHLLDFGVNLAKNKLAGKGLHNSSSRPRGHGNAGGALYPSGYGLYGDHKIPRKHKKHKKGGGPIASVLGNIFGQLLPF